MGKKMMLWKTKGMNRDLSVSAFNPEFSFENRNLRLSTNEGNTLLSWVNEKGTEELALQDGNGNTIPITGYPIGAAILNKWLVLFTTKTTADTASNLTSPNDFIYKMYLSGTAQMTITRLFSGDLNFSTLNPIETLTSYEAETIQKVYWIDGRNQSRMINIMGTIKQDSGHHDINTQFDFVQEVAFPSTVPVDRIDSNGGTFAPGVIQYCFTYCNRYGQQSNIVWVSPLQYLSFNDRGASPEEKVTCSFKITINGVDHNFDFVRLYSIQRTSINLEPIAKLLVDIPIISDEISISYIDNGTTGSLIDPMELLYIGGKDITVLTMTEKDGTLFLGNIAEKNIDVSEIQDYFKTQITDGISNIVNFGTNSTFPVDSTGSFYTYTHQLTESAAKVTTFKGGEKYRFGFQLQKKDGEWTEPIWVGDKVNTYYPSVATENGVDKIKVAYAYSSIPLTYTESGQTRQLIDTNKYVRIRPLIVYPTVSDRQVICQGVLNPTVFNWKDRVDDTPYAQASWFFRPNTNGSIETGKTVVINEDPEEGQIHAVITPRQLSDSDKNTVSYDIDQLNTTTTPAHYFRDNCVPCRIIIGSIFPDHVNSVLSSGELTYSVGTSSHIMKVPFKGAVFMGDANPATTEDNYKYAFFFTGSALNWTTFPIFKELSEQSIPTPKTFNLYSKIAVTDNHLLYYVEPTDTHVVFAQYNFDFHFATSDTSIPPEIDAYYIVFERATLNNSEYHPTSPSIEVVGSKLPFKHFNSLLTSDALNNAGEQDRDYFKQVEIEGSIKSYTAVTGDATTNKDKSNTQFFIDQSIVTLNSPDIEFDTEVQTYGLEDATLKIVGVIPITSSASAHSIKISSPKLDTNHGTNDTNSTFGFGEKNLNVLTVAAIDDIKPLHLISDYLWNDVIVSKKTNPSTTDPNEDGVTSGNVEDHLIYPWQRNGSLSIDPRPDDKAASLLSTKKLSNILFSNNTYFFGGPTYRNIKSQIALTENENVINYRFERQSKITDNPNVSTNKSGSINYYPNVDKILYNEVGYKPIVFDNSAEVRNLNNPVSMKYKSTSHAVVVLDKESSGTFTSGVPVLPILGSESSSTSLYKTFWGDNRYYYTVYMSPSTYTTNKDFLWLGELHKAPSNQFGGTTDYALRNNKWLIGGGAVDLTNASNSVTINWNQGDTYYQRYDCLKTYAFTPEDTNQIVEILSFMCETHVNIDGRYDRNRGQIDNTNMSPRNFNLLNPIYSQQNNFFTYKKVNTEGQKFEYPNQITFTKAKESGADVDLWTNINLASVLELDGDKGQITKLTRFNDQLIAFQDTGISQILYNENVQIATQNGVPIELANSGKVQGKRYISNTIGCSNKWSVVNTPSGIYFMDNNDKSIYMYNGQLQNISTSMGFNSWCKQNIPVATMKWNPVNFGADSGLTQFVGVYDKQNQDILWINKDIALAFSEKLSAFTSFYDYGNSPYFCNLNDTGIWINAVTGGTTKLWKHQAGDYGKFFGTNKPYWMTLVGNPEPQLDKVFTNLEFRASVDGDGELSQSTGKFTPTLPFDSLEAWNEYQHGYTELKNLSGHAAMVHFDSNGESSLKRKFRIWRCDIPRNNYTLPSEPVRADYESDAAYNTAMEAYQAFIVEEEAKGIYRHIRKPLDRMRNPWMYMKLTKDAATGVNTLSRAEIHDMLMIYFS